MSAPFSISEFATGGDGHLENLATSAITWMEANKMLAGLLLVALIVMIAYHAYQIWCKYMKEGMSPMATMRLVEQDTLGVTSGGQEAKPDWAREHAVAGPAPSAAAPGTLAYQVLNSSEFNCANRQSSPDDAWAWMNTQARRPGENMTALPTEDNMSKLLAGQSNSL
jgi:hypothetical protein